MAYCKSLCSTPFSRYGGNEKQIKVLLDFFQKIAESRGRASGRPAHGAKFPLAAASETPARRSGRNPQSSKAPSADGATSGQWPWSSPPPLKGWTVRTICPVPGSVHPRTVASAYRKADVHHPLGGGADGLRAYALGIAPVATGAWERWGISPAAAGDRGRRPLDPCDFLKKIE